MRLVQHTEAQLACFLLTFGLLTATKGIFASPGEGECILGPFEMGEDILDDILRGHVLHQFCREETVVKSLINLFYLTMCVGIENAALSLRKRKQKTQLVGIVRERFALEQEVRVARKDAVRARKSFALTRQRGRAARRANTPTRA